MGRLILLITLGVFFLRAGAVRLQPGSALSVVEVASRDALVPGGLAAAIALRSPLTASGQLRLELCECERATGAPNGLSCDKEGWFVSSFEHQGQWVAGGGWVPLSHATCCRPCLPSEIPQAWIEAGENEGETAGSGGEEARGTAGAPSPTGPAGSASGAVGAAGAFRPSSSARRRALVAAAAPPGGPPREGAARPDSAEAGGQTAAAGGTPASPPAPPPARPMAVVSLGCHASASQHPLHCGVDGAAVVAGFTGAIQVFTSLMAYYPVDAARCCTPALLMPDGGTWELERCDCHLSDAPGAESVSCGALFDDEGSAGSPAAAAALPSSSLADGRPFSPVPGQLLAGFSHDRITPALHLVPVAPAECCGLCLTGGFSPPRGDCAAQNRCSGRGVCVLGQCDCQAGWTGPDCSWRGRGGAGGDVPGWAIALIVLSSCALASLLVAATAGAVRVLAAAAAGEEGADADGRRPLLLRIDPDDTGSVGSQDTDDDDGDDGLRSLAAIRAAADAAVAHAVVARAVSSALRAAGEEAVGGGRIGPAADLPRRRSGAEGGARGDGDGPRGSGSATPTPPAAGAREAAGGPGLPAAEDRGAGGHGPGAAGPGSRGATAAAAAAPAPPPPPPRPASVPSTSKLASSAELSGIRDRPLGGSECVVCMSRPVQVGLVPCGHVCVCRRCSRRLTRCPVCRAEIARRQRLFV